VLRAWRAFRFRRTAGSRISRAPRWRPHDSLTSSRGRAPQPSRSIRIHRNARCEPKRCAAADAIVCGSVAVTRDGRRCGKGEGYSDLEFAILRELGHPLVPVATTVHDLQVVDSVPRDPTDQPLSVIATPTHAIRIKRPSAAPTGIDWTRLSAEDLEEMPILAELKRMTTSNA
jgi:5-formyltetrahydrofolate cyclo-ligase